MPIIQSRVCGKLRLLIAAAPDWAEVTLPVGCSYLVLDKQYQILDTNLEGEELEQAMVYAATGSTGRNLNKQYLLVTRDDEFVILQYYIGSQFTDPWLNQHLPSPEILLYLLIGANCIAVCVFLTTRFANHLRVQLVPFFAATAQVAQQNLDFEVGHSRIKEFEDGFAIFFRYERSFETILGTAVESRAGAKGTDCSLSP